MNKKIVNILKRIAGTITLPVVIYLLVMWLCYSHGKQKVFDKMWIPIIPNIVVSAGCALAIGLQFKNGRFDFSGGSIMLLSAIIAGNVAVEAGNSLPLMCVLCVVLCTVFSLLVGLFYVVARVPIVIVTIGFALLYESASCLVYGGNGITLISNMTLNQITRYPNALYPFIAAVAVYGFYSYLTTTGRKSTLLANNQQSAVNIGVKEEKAVLLSYFYSGLIFGFTTIVWIAKSKHDAAYTSMSTVGELFSNILPVFVGLMVAPFCGDTIGTVIGSVSICIFSYGLTAVYSNNLGSSITSICMGVFILLINVISAQGRNVIRAIGKVFMQSAGVRKTQS